MADTTSRFDMSFVVTPPSQLSPQERVFLPVVVRVRPTIALPPNPREQLVLHATLVKTTGTVANDVLRGNTTDSIHSRDDNAHSGYAKFDCLAIQKPGEYRLRVWLSIATDTEVVSQQYIDSDIIVVADDAADGTSHSHAPSECFAAYLMRSH